MCATVLSGTLLNCPVKPCPVLLLGRRWLIVSPAQKLRLGQPLNMKPVSHRLPWAGQSKWHLCAAQPVPPQHCCTATNVLECSKLGSLQQNEDRQAAHGVLHARDYAPQPLPKATAKLSPEQLGRVGQSQLSTAADPPWHRTAPSSGTCRAMLGVVLRLLLHPRSPAASVLPGGTAGAICSGDKHTGDCSVKEAVSFKDWLCSITRV